jgi:DNA invertase Pin-like site-specific DNA recombinase
MDVKGAAVYGRYSSEEQTGGESIEYQLERCREYVVKKGWSLDESNVFVDRARAFERRVQSGCVHRVELTCPPRMFPVLELGYG